MTIRVNDEPRKVSDRATVQDLLQELNLAERRGLAVAVNDEVVPRSAWGARTLAARDHVLLIQASQGG